MTAGRVGTAIIGGGIAGCAVAHYMAEEGETDIVLVEADELGSGSTGGSFGGVRQQFSTALEIELSRRGLEFWRTAERVFDSPVAWHSNGYLFLTGQPDIMSKLAEAATLQRSMGLTDVHVLDPEQIRDTVSWVGTDGVLGGTYTPGDGKVTPTEGVAALVKAARSRGVKFREHWPVRALERNGRTWRVVGPDILEAERVVVCAGYWTSDLMRPLGLELTIRPVPLYAAITAPALVGQRVPLTIDLDTGLLIEREAGGLLVAILLEEIPPGYGHARMLEDFADLARVRAPSLADLRIARHVVANVDLGGDGHPYVGLVEDGMWMLAGFGGHGAMHAPPVAKLLAQTIAGRPDSTLDISDLSPWRTSGAAAEWMVAAKKG
jgi:sarcosine oxidase subunit beta